MPDIVDSHPRAAPDAQAPDLRHVRDWVFDLDNTLYPAACGLFAQIDGRMTDYVARFLGKPPEEARRIQKTLYREHGTTLNGLIRVYGADPEPYLDFVHDIDLGGLTPDPVLARALARLPGRRTIFTNGCARHARRILRHLEIEPLFETVFDIRAIAFIPKPDARAYARMAEAAGLSAGASAMFDDIARNLVAAHGLGMTTVWVRGENAWAGQGPDFPVASDAHIDHETDDLPAFLNRIRI